MKKLYRALLPYEIRYFFYKLRHPAEFKMLRWQVYSSPRGDFSLRSFDKQRCIFIHIPKSAGTSVAQSLFGELPYHYTAVQYRVIYGRRTYNQYFKFAFVRNPWDRLYSGYSYLKNGGWNEEDRIWYSLNLSHLVDFNTFVIDWLNPQRLNAHMHFRPQVDFICDRRQRPIIDYLGYFETLSDDFAYITRKMNLAAELFHFNASKRESYRDVYISEAIEKVNQLYRSDIELFGYDFQGVKTRKTIYDGQLISS